MTTKAMKQALEVISMLLENYVPEATDEDIALIETTITSIHQAIAEAEKQDHIEQHLEMVEQEPTCKQRLQVWVISNCKGAGQFSWEPQDEKFWTRMVPANTHPPKREPLTDEQIDAVWTNGYKDFARAIEAAHGIKGKS
jgi:hypothetical protein